LEAGETVLLALPPGVASDVAVEVPMTQVGEVVEPKPGACREDMNKNKRAATDLAARAETAAAARMVDLKVRSPRRLPTTARRSRTMARPRLERRRATGSDK